jgi:hypothetical protein
MKKICQITYFIKSKVLIFLNILYIIKDNAANYSIPLVIIQIPIIEEQKVKSEFKTDAVGTDGGV